MELIQKLEVRIVTSKTGKTRRERFGIFKCPHCKDLVGYEMIQGKRTKACSNRMQT